MHLNLDAFIQKSLAEYPQELEGVKTSLSATGRSNPWLRRSLMGGQMRGPGVHG